MKNSQQGNPVSCRQSRCCTINKARHFNRRLICMQRKFTQPHHRYHRNFVHLRFFFFSSTEVFTCSKVINAFKQQNPWTDPFGKSSASFALIFPISFFLCMTFVTPRYPQFPRSPLRTPGTMMTIWHGHKKKTVVSLESRFSKASSTN